MKKLLAEIKTCRVCKDHLPFEPLPIVQAASAARIIIIGQAPGLKVQQTGIPWNDASGKKLREWLGVSDAEFYNPKKIALVPMGFCYPGKGGSGDMPPRPECAPLWHHRLLSTMKKAELIILIGHFAQSYYIGEHAGINLTETVKSYSAKGADFKKNNDSLLPFFPIPHPSPRNRFWLTKNKWFESETLPLLKKRVQKILQS